MAKNCVGEQNKYLFAEKHKR